MCDRFDAATAERAEAIGYRRPAAPLGRDAPPDRSETLLATESLAAQMQAKHSEMMRLELEAVALRLFEQHGFSEVTVDKIAAEAGISARTFYRYFPAKEDVFQVRIDVRSERLRDALAARPADEAPMPGLRLAYEAVLHDEDADLTRQWTAVIAVTPSVLMGVVGGIQLKAQPVVAEYFGVRLGLPSDALEPTMLAAATGGVVQASQTRWFLRGGDLSSAIAEGLQVLEQRVEDQATRATKRPTKRATRGPASPTRRRRSPG